MAIETADTFEPRCQPHEGQGAHECKTAGEWNLLQSAVLGLRMGAGATLAGMEYDELEMWETIAARHEKEWKRIWGDDEIAGPLVYWRDVAPYKNLVRFARLKLDQPVCWGAPDCLDKKLTKCAKGKHDTCGRHTNHCFLCTAESETQRA
jgi:hypothetical protein